MGEAFTAANGSMVGGKGEETQVGEMQVEPHGREKKRQLGKRKIALDQREGDIYASV